MDGGCEIEGDGFERLTAALIADVVFLRCVDKVGVGGCDELGSVFFTGCWKIKCVDF